MSATCPEARDRALTIWVLNPFDDIPGEGLPPMRFWSLSSALAARGHHVTWWTASWSHRRKARRRPPADLEQAEGFGLQLVDVRPYDRNVSLARIASHRDFGDHLVLRADALVASGAMRRPDMILASLPPLEGAEAAIRLARRHGAAFIVDIMDLWPETFERLLPGPSFVRRLIGPLALGRMRMRRRAIVAAAAGVSAATRTYLEATLADAGGGRPTHVCYLGARLPGRSAAGPAPAAGEAARPLACVYAGSLETGQDLDTLVAACRRLAVGSRGVRIHVAGTGRLEPMLRAAAATIRGSCELRIHGLLRQPEYESLLAACDVGLVLVKPASRVAVPYKACDYAAAGLAIVNSLPGELQSLIDAHRAGVAYDAGAPDSLADAIARLAGGGDTLAAMRAGARELAADEFDRSRTYPRFAAWIEQIGAARGGPA